MNIVHLIFQVLALSSLDLFSGPCKDSDMPRPALTPEQKQENRRRIRQAAAELFAEKGISNITARAIATKAGVSVGNIYANFDSLTELMQSLWKEPLNRLLAEMENTAANTADPEQRLRKLIKHYINFATRQHGVYRGAFMFVRPQSLDKPSKVDVEQDRFYRLFKQTIRDGQQLGQFVSGNPSTLTHVLWAALHGAIALPDNLDRLDLPSSEQLAKHMSKFLLASLKQTNS